MQCIVRRAVFMSKRAVKQSNKHGRPVRRMPNSRHEKRHKGEMGAIKEVEILAAHIVERGEEDEPSQREGDHPADVSNMTV